MSFIERKKAGILKLYSGLIGRRAEIAAVKYAIRQMENRVSSGLKVRDYPNLFYFYGPVGSGKSTLLRTIYEDCERGELGFQPLDIWFDCSKIAQSEATAEESFVVELTRAVVNTEPQLKPHFQPVFDFWDNLIKEASPLGVPGNNLPATAAPAPAPSGPVRVNPVKAAYGSISSIDIKKSAGGKQNVKDIARSVNRNMQAMEAAQRTPIAPPTVNTKGEIVKRFAQAVDQMASHFRVILYLDNFETFERSEEWFRHSFLKSFQKELIFVIAGETDLHTTYLQEFGNVASCVALHPFSVFETGHLLAHQTQISDPKVVVSAHRLSGGNPLCVAMIASALQHIASKEPAQMAADPGPTRQARLFALQQGLPAAQSQAAPSPTLKFLEWPGDDYGDKINKYIAYIMLDEIPKADQNLLAVLALMNRFYPELFQHLSGVMNVQRTLETLSQRYSFVSPEGEMMEFMKRTLRGYFKQEMEDLFDEIMRGAYTYMAELVKQQPQNLNLLVDAMYYYFHLDFRVAYRHYVNLVSHYMNSQLDFCDRLAAEMLSCSIPQEVKHKIRSMSRSLGWFRKKDPNGSQFIMAEVANPEPIEHEEMRFMSDLFLLGDH